MIRKTKRVFLIVGICLSVSAQFLYAQDLDISQKQAGYGLTVDEALDLVEKDVDQVSKEVTHTEEGSKTEIESDVSREVNVLEDIVFEEEVLEKKIIPLLHVEASNIIDTLNQMKGPTGEVTYNQEDNTLILKDFPEQLEAMSTYVKEVDILLETEVFKLKYAQAKDIIEKVRGVLTKNAGKAELDQQENKIIATDTSSKIESIKRLISSLDFFNKEIQIKTKTLQIVLNDEHVEGVDWEAIVSDFQNIEFSGFSSETNLTGEKGLKVGAVSIEDYEILLEALDTVGVMSSVKDDEFKTENKETKTVNILSSLQNENLNSDEKGDNDQSKTVHFYVTPTINPKDLITMAVQLGSANKKFDRLDQTSDTQTTIQIKNGETIVIGSLFEEVMVESMWKIPLLGDLPLLGFVFRNQGEKPRRSEIITFLTATIIEKFGR